MGTAYAASSRVWFTFWSGIITEVYYPTVDRPQLRDLQYLVTDGKSFFHDEKRHLEYKLERLSDHVLGYRCINSDPARRYAIVKEIIADPHMACVLQHTRLTGDESFLSQLRLYVLCGPHLEVGGWGNNGFVARVAGRTVLMADRKGTWLALADTVPLSHVSCGYVGKSDGWIDLSGNFQMDWEFDHAPDGNIALTGELDLTGTREFTLGLAFGNSQHHAVSTLFQSLSTPFAEHGTTPLRALIYLNVSQQENGGFAQNFWIGGEPYWHGVQLDEVAFPILLAWRLRRENALQDFDPYPMVLRAAAYLVRHGALTPQERWEEVSGYSPSTLASNIAALICAACMARERGDEATAKYLEEYADFLECHIESWTVTTEGTLLPGVPRHYLRILPERADNPDPAEDPNQGNITIANRPPGSQTVFAAKEIGDAGFLELVRHGVRRADDPLIVDSLKVIDAVLKVETPFGPCWRRYNHDGYGQRDDGCAFVGWGKGRAWPLLTGERGHYEMAAGHDTKPYIRAMENLASATGLLPEQSWDGPDRPDVYMYCGRPTGSAMPLMWAHAEYIKLLRSVRDGKLSDMIVDIADRYLGGRADRQLFEVWKLTRQVRSVKRGYALRIQVLASFRLHWSSDEWQTVKDTHSSATTLGVEFVDILILAAQQMPIRFTFFWTAGESWEGRDYLVSIA